MQKYRLLFFACECLGKAVNEMDELLAADIGLGIIRVYNTRILLQNLAYGQTVVSVHDA